MPGTYGVCAFDGNGRLRYVSHTFGAFDVDEVIGKPVWQSCEDEDTIRNAFAKCLLTGDTVSAESNVIDPDGSTYRVRYTFFALPHDHHCRVVSVWHEPAAVTPLSEQEWTILGLIADGLRNIEIRKRLNLSDSTVKTALRRVRDKLRAQTNAQAVAIAVRSGVL